MQDVKGWDGSANRKPVIRYKNRSKDNEEMIPENWSPKKEQRNKNK